MARRKARFSSDRILGKMRALAVHFTTVYIYALTLTDPPPHLAHLKGIRRIGGQTALSRPPWPRSKDEMPLSPTEYASINSCAAWAS